jgi:hypothetical protein
MDVLLSFTGFQDPYAIGLVGQEEQPGPILSLVSARSFDRIILFSTPNTESNTTVTSNALQSLYPNIDSELLYRSCIGYTANARVLGLTCGKR